MKTIWKFDLAIVEGSQEVQMPKGAKVITAGVQQHMRGGDYPRIWAEVDPDAEMESRHFEVFGTGWEIPEERGMVRKYITTAIADPFVWHFYERF